MDISNKKEVGGFVKKSLLKNWTYNIQKSFYKFDYSEIVFINPLQANLVFTCNRKSYKLKKNCLKVVKVKNVNKVQIRSNCTLMRPIVFSYKNHYFDVHHG